jgi:hypothetical protein
VTTEKKDEELKKTEEKVIRIELDPEDHLENTMSAGRRAKRERNEELLREDDNGQG